jgi:hypothetical protein
MVVVNKQMIMISRKLIIVGSIVLVLLALVLARSCDQQHFRNDLGKLATPSLGKQNLLTINALAKMEKPLFVVLDNANTEALKGEILKISLKDITQREQLNKIKNFKGPKVLLSENIGTSAETWMILSQMGIANLYLLDTDANEVFKYSFRADTIIN